MIGVKVEQQMQFYIIGPRNFSGGTYDFIRIFFKFDEPNFLKFGKQPLWGKSKRMSKPLFDFRKIRPWRAKKRPLLALFWPFLQFFGLETFSESEIFYFLIWCFWAYLEVICKKLWKKGQNSTLQGQKTVIFGPFLAIFAVFRTWKFF